MEMNGETMPNGKPESFSWLRPVRKFCGIRLLVLLSACNNQMNDNFENNNEFLAS